MADKKIINVKSYRRKKPNGGYTTVKSHLRTCSNINKQTEKMVFKKRKELEHKILDLKLKKKELKEELKNYEFEEED